MFFIFSSPIIIVPSISILLLFHVLTFGMFPVIFRATVLVRPAIFRIPMSVPIPTIVPIVPVSLVLGSPVVLIPAVFLFIVSFLPLISFPILTIVSIFILSLPNIGILAFILSVLTSIGFSIFPMLWTIFRLPITILTMGIVSIVSIFSSIILNPVVSMTLTLLSIVSSLPWLWVFLLILPLVIIGCRLFLKNFNLLDLLLYGLRLLFFVYHLDYWFALSLLLNYDALLHRFYYYRCRLCLSRTILLWISLV